MTHYREPIPHVLAEEFAELRPLGARLRKLAGKTGSPGNARTVLDDAAKAFARADTELSGAYPRQGFASHLGATLPPEDLRFLIVTAPSNYPHGKRFYVTGDEEGLGVSPQIEEARLFVTSDEAHAIGARHRQAIEQCRPGLDWCVEGVRLSELPLSS